MAANTSREQPNLDLIRATAVLCVFGGHLYGAAFNDQASLNVWRFAQLGVIIFFVHTAYVLMWSLERSSTLPPRELVMDFYVRRVFRIYPLAMLFVMLAWFGLIGEGSTFSTFDLVANLALAMNLVRAQVMWGVQWTLPIEVQMYVLLPLLFLFLRTRHVAAVGVICVVAVIAGMLQPTNRLNVMEYAPCFMGGVLAWHLARRYEPRLPAAWWPVAFVALWTIWLVTGRDGREPFRWAFCLALGSAIPWFKPLAWKPITAPAAWIAKYSYGIYLSHAAIFAFGLGFPIRLVRWPLLIGLAVVVPVLLYLAIEDPMIRAGKSLAAFGVRRAGRERPAVLAT